MIRYTLKCDQDHSFESWFQNASAFDELRSAGHVACPHCGSSNVEKSLMAPTVRPARSAVSTPPEPSAQISAAPDEAAQSAAQSAAKPDALVQSSNSDATTIAAPSPEVSKQIAAEIAKIRAKVEAESDYVGKNFAKEARAMHLGDTPERAIYGEAKLEEAKELIEDGVALLPLPFTPTRKIN